MLAVALGNKLWWFESHYRHTSVQEGGRTLGPVWTGVENFDATGVRSPDRPARSESLYRLSYHGPHFRHDKKAKCNAVVTSFIHGGANVN